MSSLSIERGLYDFKAVIDAPIASYFSSCVHCGLCAEACLFYVETGDPKYTPIRKLEPLRRVWEQEYTIVGKLKKLVGLSKPVTDDELEEWKELLYASCTMCGRCSQVCPVGNDIAYMVRKAREGMVSSGHAPEPLVGAATRAVKIGSPMGVKWPAVQNQIKHVEADTGLKIPIDVQGAEYMPLLSSMEIINFPEYLGALAKIFKQAGITWTIASKAFEATNAGLQIGSSDIERELVVRVVDEAERLGVKFVIGPECGHAFNAIRWDGPELIGRPYKFRVLPARHGRDQLRRHAGCRYPQLVLRRRRRREQHGGVRAPPAQGLRRQAQAAGGGRARAPGDGVRQLPADDRGGPRALQDGDPDRRSHRDDRRAPERGLRRLLEPRQNANDLRRQGGAGGQREMNSYDRTLSR